MTFDQDWKKQDKAYHEDRYVVDSFDRRIIQKFQVEHKYFTLNPWIKELKDNKAQLVLDFGCATGTASIALLKEGIRAISLDASEQMILRTRQKALHESLLVNGVLADAEQMPFKAETFDGIICMGVLHHLPNMLKGLEEQIRVLKMGGRIYISEPYEHIPWLSYPYRAMLSIAKYIVGLFKAGSVSSPEIVLRNENIKNIKEILDKNGLEYEIQYLIYWSNICGYLPEKMAYFLVRLLNKLNEGRELGEIVIIKARKRI